MLYVLHSDCGKRVFLISLLLTERVGSGSEYDGEKAHSALGLQSM
jgi:hypothetical protein